MNCRCGNKIIQNEVVVSGTDRRIRTDATDYKECIECRLKHDQFDQRVSLDNYINRRDGFKLISGFNLINQ
jgi:hypothetical protein